MLGDGCGRVNDDSAGEPHCGELFSFLGAKRQPESIDVDRMLCYTAEAMVLVDLMRIVINENSDEQIIYLKEVGGERSFPIVIGIFEAAAIDRIIKQRHAGRPLTHDLIANVIVALGGQLVRSVVDDLRDGTYFAKLVIKRESDGEEIVVDARPSDAVTLAKHCDVPIYVAEKVMNSVGTTE